MPNKRFIKAEILFHKFAESAVQSGFSNSKAFYCPLCLREFKDFRVSWANNELSIEHIPMKALGAKTQMLTCSYCNHLFGYKYQPSLETAQILQRIRRGDDTKTVKAAVELGSKRLRGRIWFERGKGLRFEESKKGSPPKESNYWNRKGPSIIMPRLRARLEMPLNQDAAKRSLLRDAYLLMFNSWGCWLLKEAWSEEIRKRLTDATIPIPEGAIVQITLLPLDLNPTIGEFLLTTGVEDLKCYLIPVIDRYVCLPTEGDITQCVKIWRKFEQIANTDHKMEIQLMKVIFHENVKSSPRLVVRKISDEPGQPISSIEVIGTS